MDFIYLSVAYLKRLTKTGAKVTLFIGVIFFVMALFNALQNSGTEAKKITPEEYMSNISRAVLSDKNDPRFATPQGKEVHKAYLASMCGMSGFGCNNDPGAFSEEKYNASIFGKITLAGAIPMMNPPASGMYEVASTVSRAGLVPQTYAASGLGFASLYPFNDAWKQLRSVAYMFIVLVVIAAGFIIIFRANINPQTVVTIEAVVPRLILSILFIELSFAISGFLIDLTYIVSGLVVTVLGPIAIPNISGPDMNDLISKWIYSGPDDILSGFVGNIQGANNFGRGWMNLFWRLPNGILNIFGIPMAIVFRIFTLFFSLHILSPTIGSLLTFVDKFELPIYGQPAGVGAGVEIVNSLAQLVVKYPLQFGVTSVLAVTFVPLILIGVFLMLAIIGLAIRILIMLIKAYINILLLILFAPFVIMFNVIPGKDTFLGWVKSLVRELSVFPLTIAVFFFGYIIAFSGIDGSGTGGQLVRFPLINFGDVGRVRDTFPFIVGMAVLLMTPTLVPYLQNIITPKGMDVPKFDPSLLAGGLAGFGIGRKSRSFINKMADPRERALDPTLKSQANFYARLPLIGKVIQERNEKLNEFYARQPHGIRTEPEKK